MAPSKSSLIACVLAIWFLGLAHSEQAPSPAVDCSSLILNMADCLSFVSNDSTVRKPEGKCCKGLGSVLKTKPECLCEAFMNSAQLGVALNLTRALALPAACKLSAPPLSECHLSLGPAAAPASTSPSSSPAYSPEANEMAPTPVPGNIGSSLASMSIESILCVPIAVALLSSL